MATPVHHVYFVHGIGKHSASWIDDDDLGTTLRKKITAAWDAYQPRPGALDDHIALHSIAYDHVFGDLYAHWKTQADGLLAHVANLPGAAEQLSAFTEAMSKPANEAANDNFFYTHLLDLFWYRLNGLIQGKIVAHVASKILDDIKQHFDQGNHSFSIVAHSMGTSVVHKVLQALYTEPQHGGQLSSFLKFRLLMQVSNTSLVLSADRDRHYDTLVKPSRFANRPACDYMVNVLHRLDPVAALVPFDPDLEFWLDGNEIREGRYEQLRLSRMTDVHVHSIVHYFDNPRVQAAFFEHVLDRRIPASKKKQLWDAFEARTPEGRFKQIKKDYEEILRHKADSIAEYLQLIKRFRDLWPSLP